MSPGSPRNSLASTVVLEFLKMASMPISLPHFLLRTGHVHQRFRSLTRCFVTSLVLKTLAFIHGPHWNSSGRFLSLQDPFHDRHAETERTAFCYILSLKHWYSRYFYIESVDPRNHTLVRAPMTFRYISTLRQVFQFLLELDVEIWSDPELRYIEIMLVEKWMIYQRVISKMSHITNFSSE